MEFHLCDSLFRFLHNEPHSLLVLFLASMIALSSMVAIARPVLRENLYQIFEKEDVVKMYDYGERGLL